MTYSNSKWSKTQSRKIKSIPKISMFTEAKQIIRFLEFLGYYKKYIKYYVEITKPLTTNLKKYTIINPLDQKMSNGLSFVKHLSRINEYPDLSPLFNLTTAASN